MIMTITRALVKHPHDRRLAAGGHLGPFQLVITVTPSVAHGAGQLASPARLTRWSTSLVSPDAGRGADHDGSGFHSSHPVGKWPLSQHTFHQQHGSL